MSVPRRTSFAAVLRRGSRRPKGANKLPEHESFFEDDEEAGLGGFGSPGSKASASSMHGGSSADSDTIVDADPRLAAHLSEQQSIISALRAEIKAAKPQAELLSSLNFQALVARLGTAQQELRELLSAGSKPSPNAQKLLVRQSKQMLELLSQLTEPADESTEESSCSHSAGTTLGYQAGSEGSATGADASLGVERASSAAYLAENTSGANPFFGGNSFGSSFGSQGGSVAFEGNLFELSEPSIEQPPPQMGSAAASRQSTVPRSSPPQVKYTIDNPPPPPPRPPPPPPPPPHAMLSGGSSPAPMPRQPQPAQSPPALIDFGDASFI